LVGCGAGAAQTPKVNASAPGFAGAEEEFIPQVNGLGGSVAGAAEG